MNFPIFDLHCDLLLYLTQGANRTAIDPLPGCSLPQLQQGGVKTQVFAIFSETKPGSAQEGLKQLETFQKLRKENANWLQALAAIENAASLIEQEEPLEQGFDRIRNAKKNGIPFAYASLTWNEQNRFGGGTLTPREGIKDDGRALLNLLAELNIPVDLSHASDLLAEDILNEIDRSNLKLPVIASHSNSRSVHLHMRNLPNSIAAEIFKRGGIIGLNFVSYFVGGDEPYDIFKHYDAFTQLGGKGHICFGADYFYPDDMGPNKKLNVQYFSPHWKDASCYPYILNNWIENKLVTLDEAAEVAYKSARQFYSSHTNVLAV